MRKVLLLAGMFCLFSGTQAFAQVAATVPALEIPILMQIAKQATQIIQQAAHWKKQIEHQIKQTKQMVKQVTGGKMLDVWKNFEQFKNRAMFLKGKADEKLTQKGITIEGQFISYAELERIKTEAGTVLAAEWDSIFSKAQREKILKEYGMSAGNYLYRKAQEAFAEEIERGYAVASQTANDDYLEAMKKHKEILTDLSKDKGRSADDKMSDKAIAEYGLQTAIDSNKVLRDMYYAQEAERQRQLAEREASLRLPEAPRLSEAWNYDVFAEFSD
jgi:hypothetical protein